MIASVTELRLKNFWSYVRFIPHAVRNHRQASRSVGLISLSVASEGFLIQRTLTVWRDEQAMLDFLRGEAHREAMKAFTRLANRSFTARFETERVPDWQESLDYLRTHGRSHG